MMQIPTANVPILGQPQGPTLIPVDVRDENGSREQVHAMLVKSVDAEGAVGRLGEMLSEVANAIIETNAQAITNAALLIVASIPGSNPPVVGPDDVERALASMEALKAGLSKHFATDTSDAPPQ